MGYNQSRLPAPVRRYLGKLRFPTLFLVTAALFVIDLFVPDFVPMADEILLGLATVLLGRITGKERGIT